MRELTRLSDPNRVRPRARCIGVEERDGQVQAFFADGRDARGDFLVGADGLRSVVRARLFGESPSRYAGYVCWRGVATLERAPLEPHTAFETWGRGMRFSVHPCGHGRVFWWATRNGPPNGADGPRGRKGDLQEMFSTWHEPIPSVLAATTEILRNDILDRPPIRVWGRGRIMLLGDAAHPTTPNLGQGACQAMEDAVVLADQLRRHTHVESALRAYERIRQPRTASITNESRRIGRVCQWRDPLASWFRNSMTRLIPSMVTLRYLERFFHQDLPEL